MNAPVRSALIIRCGALGDLIYATAVMDALRMQYGESIAIDWVCTPATGTLFRHDPRVRRVFPLKHRKVPLRLSPAKLRIVRASRRTPYDLLINLETGRQFFDLARAVRAGQKVGAPFTQTEHDPARRHMVDRVKEIYAPLLSDTVFKRAAPRLYGEEPARVKTRYGLPDAYVVINASNSHIKKHRINYRAWPQPHWKALIERLSPRIVCVLIAGRGEERYFEHIRPFPPNTLDLTGRTPLADLIAIIAGARAVITTDTGPAHMASAVNTPVFALIGPTPADETGPYPTADNTVRLLSAGLECSPCYRTPTMHACTDNRCMQLITPQMVADAVEAFLER